MIDNDFILKESGLVASCNATVITGATIVDLGLGLVEGHLICDVTAIEIVDNDELYTILLQGSSESDFASTIEKLAILELGANEVLDWADVDSTVGRYIVPFRTERNGTNYQYVRLICDVDGTVASGVNFSAHLEK
jgi:hypothetical protein